MAMNKFTELQMDIMREMDRFVHLKSVSDLKFVSVTNFKEKLTMNYNVRDRDLKNNYAFEVENVLLADQSWIRWQTPYLKLLSPAIRPNLDIHLLLDSSICYTFPGDVRYDKGLTCGYAIEQSFKWVFGYEFYLKEHYWPFEEMPHGAYPVYWGFTRPSLAA